MKVLILFLLAIINCRILIAQDFAYMNHVDLFEYLKEPRGGLALFPIPGNKEVQLRWFNDKESLKRKLKNNEIKDTDIIKILNSILDTKNYLGFVHFSACLAKTGREQEAFKIYKSLLAEDERRNFCILYGLYVMKEFSGKEKSELFVEPIKDLVKHVKNSGFKVEKTKRFPDLISTLASSTASVTQ